MYRFMCKPFYKEIAFFRFSTANNSISTDSGYVRGRPVQLDSSWTASGPVQIYGLGEFYVYNLTRVHKNQVILNTTRFLRYRFMCKPLYT